MSGRFRAIRTELSGTIHDCVSQYRKARDEFHKRDLLEQYLQRVDPLLGHLAYWQLRAFGFLGVTFDDLLQWARLASLEALERFNLSRNTDYTAYLISYVKRYVYNKILDELPVPREVSKRISKLLREGKELSDLPQSLRAAYHLRNPIQVENQEILRLCDTDEQVEHTEILDELAGYLGGALWEDLIDAFSDPRDSCGIEYLIVQIELKESVCPQSMRSYLRNLRSYLILLAQNR